MARSVKLATSGGWRCFYCNTFVNREMEKCPSCGCEFVQTGRDEGGVKEPEAENSSGRSVRLQQSFRVRRQSYTIPLIVLAICSFLLAVLLRPKPRHGVLLSEPGTPRPSYRILEMRQLPLQGINRISLVGLARPELPDESFKAVLDWMLYNTLYSENHLRRQAVRVVWAYVLTDSLAPRSHWRAMAIWTDSLLPKPLRPAGIGGDAIRQGQVEYDVTNPLLQR